MSAPTEKEIIADLLLEIDAANARDIRDEHMIAELRISLADQTALAERTVRENLRLKMQLNDALAEIAEMKSWNEK